MLGKKSIAKGKRYERHVAKRLSEWSGIELVRTPDGAPEDIYADVWPKDVTEYFPLAVECKCCEGWSLDQIMAGTGSLYDWLRQAQAQSENATNALRRIHIPMLVFSKNYTPDYVAVPFYLRPDSVLLRPAIMHWLVVKSYVAEDEFGAYFIAQLESYLELKPYTEVRDCISA